VPTRKHVTAWAKTLTAVPEPKRHGKAIVPTLRARLGQGTSGACTRYAGSSPIFLMMGSAGSDERNFTSAAAPCRSFALAGVAVA
jgi:hypothetical protein